MGYEIMFSNVLLTLLYIVPGYLVCKMKKASAEHLSTLSTILVYICSPCMIVSSFMSLDFSMENLKKMGCFFIVTLVLQVAFMLGLFFLFHKKYEDSRYRILTIGSVLGNVGFFGLPIIKAILPNNPEVMSYSSIYVVSMNTLVFTAGVYCLTKDKKFLKFKSAIFNPATFGFVIALPLYLFGAKNWLPDLLKGGISLLGSMTTPICMIILGIRLATVSFKKLFCRPFIYLICFGKLIVFPLFCYLAVYFLPVDNAFKLSILVLSGVPCASVILNMAEIYKSETELSANCVLLSTLLCLFTMPLLMMIAV